MTPGSPSSQAPAPPRVSLKIKAAIAVASVLAIAALTWAFRGELTLEGLAARESQLRQLQQERPLVVYSLAFFLYVAVTGLSLPGATPLSIAYGWLFRFWPALVLVSFASTAGATLAFLLSRYLFRDAVRRRFGGGPDAGQDKPHSDVAAKGRYFHSWGLLESVNRELEREGAFYLFTLRLVPVAPFFVINLAMGLTPMRAVTFWWVSQAGMLPATMVFVGAGASVPTLADVVERGEPIITWQTVAALALLGILPLAARAAVRWLRRRRVS